MRFLKYLAKHKVALLLVTVLLIANVFCDLMLPNYTSQIVDVGIQQAGVEHVAADELSKETHDSLMAGSSAGTAGSSTDSTSTTNTAASATENAAAAFDSQLFEDSYRYDESTGTYKLTPYGWQHIDELDIMMARPMAQIHGLAQSGAESPEADSASQASSTQDEGGLARQVGIAAARAEYEQLGYDLSERQMHYLVLTGLKMMGFVLASALLFICIGFISARTAASIGRELRERLFRKVIAFNDADMQRFSTASLITRGTNDVQQIQMTSAMFMRMVMYAPIMAIGGIIMVSQLNVSMSWLIGIAVVAIFVAAGALMVIAMPKFRIMQKLIDRVNLISREMITGVSVVRAFGQQSREQRRFDKANTDLMRTQLFTNRAMTFLMPIMTMIMNLVSVAIVWIGGREIDAGIIQTGDLIAFITYAMLIITSFLILSMLAIILPRADVSAQRLDEVFAAEVSITDPAQPVELPQVIGLSQTGEEAPQACETPQPSAPPTSAAQGVSIAFDHVSFSYADDCEPVLHDISFQVEPGQVCAFIGSTGSGKSTVIKLIERFYDVTEGAVLVNGVDVRSLRLKDLRALFGYVPQRSFLFAGTVESNVGFGEETPDSARIDEAIDIAQAAQFVQEKPDGLKAEITQGGTNVSGGQRQRLAIARALATQAPGLLFDDCFSALDYKTDAALRRQLQQRLPGRTQVIVAQRIATVMHADIIIVLDDGRIVGRGTHAELMQTCEQYREIAYSQLSADELEGPGAHSQQPPEGHENQGARTQRPPETSEPSSAEGGDAR